MLSFLLVEVSTVVRPDPWTSDSELDILPYYKHQSSCMEISKASKLNNNNNNNTLFTQTTKRHIYMASDKTTVT